MIVEILSKEDAEIALEGAPWRIVGYLREQGNVASYQEDVHIFYDGNWWALARADKKLQVTSDRYTGYRNRPDPVQEYLEKVRYGAALSVWMENHQKQRIFAVLDRMTDG